MGLPFYNSTLPPPPPPPTHTHTQPGGCAAQTGRGLSVGQQILQVSGTSLFGLKHRDTVMAIKNAFEGPLNKTMEIVVLDHETDE